MRKKEKERGKKTNKNESTSERKKHKATAHIRKDKTQGGGQFDQKHTNLIK